MGAWEKLDTEISVEIDFGKLNNAINSTEFKEVKEYLEDIKVNIEKGSKEGVKEIAIFNRSFQQQWLSDLSRYPYATGVLSSSITEEKKDEYRWLVGTSITHFYPLTLEFGRREIRPVHAKALFFYSLSGEPVFTKYVKPAKPKPFVQPAFDRTEQIADSMMFKSISQYLD